MRPFLNLSVTYIDAKYTDASEAEKVKILHIHDLPANDISSWSKVPFCWRINTHCS